MQNILKFSSDHTFREWLHKNRYSKDDNFTSVWTKEGKCVAGTVEKRRNGERAWEVVIY